MLYRTVSIHEQSGEGEELGPCLLEEVVPYRQFTAQEVELLGMLAGLEVRCQPLGKGLGMLTVLVLKLVHCAVQPLPVVAGVLGNEKKCCLDRQL